MMRRSTQKVSAVGGVGVWRWVGQTVVALLAVVARGVRGQLEAGHVARLHERVH